MADLQWRWARLGELQAEDLYDALMLRSRVFVVEQHCVYLDADGVDRQAWHLLGRGAPQGAGPGPMRAVLRVVDPGVKYDEPSIGRVVTAPEARGTGLGLVLMREGLARCRSVWPGRAVRISAQAHLQRFYGTLGFQPVGEAYLEDGIPHVEMLCPAGDPPR